MNKDVYSLLGLASRARKVVSGDLLIASIRKKESSFVIIATDASENSFKKISDKCKFYGIQYVVAGTIDEISKAIGKNNRVAIGISDHGFSKKIKEKIIGGN